MRKPRALRAGDEVRVVSPASPVRPEQTASGIALLESAGYRVTLGRHVYARDGYLAGSDADRAADLNEAFADPGVAAVFCSRGGYGCARLLPLLDLDAMAATGKLFAGFSDVTTLHLALNRRGLATLHSPMLLSFSVERPGWVVDSLLRALQGDPAVPDVAPKGECLVPGEAVGPVTGGCLCLVTDSLATPESLDARGKILLIEDVDEQPHRVDAMLTHLLASGALRSAAGIVVGEMTRTDENVDPQIGEWPWRRIVKDRLEGLNLPTVIGYPFGHMPAMLSLPLGVEARLNASAGTLAYLEAWCEA
jgi:muramoyltetrapeptide carboxypeptidase